MKILILQTVIWTFINDNAAANILNAFTSVTLSIQKFKVNAMLNAFENRCVIFVVQYIIKK